MATDPCDCMAEIDKHLADHNGRLETVLRFGAKPGEPSAFVSIGTETINTKLRIKPPVIVPSFCPFCGTSFKARGEPA